MNLKKLKANMMWYSLRLSTLSVRPNGKFLHRQEKRLQAEANRIFKRQMNWVVNNLRIFDALRENSIKRKENNSLDSDINNFLSGMPGKTEMVENILIYASLTMDKGGRETIKINELKKFGISFSLKNPLAVAYLNQKKALELSNFKGNVHSRTEAKVKSIITKAVESGQNYSDTATQIMAQGKAGVFSYARAEMIAVREAGEAYEFGKSAPIEEFLARNPSRQVMKEWNTSNDSAVTPECQENQDSSPYLYSEVFPSGDNTAPRSGNPRCRCWTTYQVLD